MHRSRGAFLFFLMVIMPVLFPFAAHAQFPFFESPIVPCGNNVQVTHELGGPNQDIKYLCIYGECNTCGLVAIAKNLIGFAVFLAVVVAAIMFTYAGGLYLLSAANPGNIAKAHRIFWDVLLGLVFVLAAWMVVDVIMKTLYGDGPQGWGPWNEVLCGALQDVRDCRVEEVSRAGEVGVPPVTYPGPAPTPGGPPPVGTKGCSSPNGGFCAVAALTTYFGGNAWMAAGICGQESGNNPNSESRSDRCADGHAFSIGLFQINLTQHDLGMGCMAAFNGKNYKCTVKDLTLYNKCVAAAKDPAINSREAAKISGGGGNWGQWSTNCTCHFPPWPNQLYCKK